MSLIQIAELPDHTTRHGERGKREHTRKYLGLSNNPYEGTGAILASSLCPKVGQRDIADPAAYIIGVEAARKDPEDPDVWWIITITTSTDSDPEQNIHPLSLPAKISWHAEQYQRYTEVDNKGKYIRTAAGTILPVQIEDSRWVISVSKLLASPPAYLLNFNNAINSGTIAVDGIPFPKEKLMCKSLRIGEVVFDTFQNQRLSYREVSFQLHYRKEGWKVKTIDADFVEKKTGYFLVKKPDGTFEFDENNKPLRKYETRRVKIMIGEPRDYITEPWPLKANGEMLPENYQPEQVRYVETDAYTPQPFALLPLR